MQARDAGLRRVVGELDRRPVVARERRDAAVRSAREHLVVLRRCDRVPGDLRDAQVQQLVAGVAERLAGELVDRDVAHVLVRDEDEGRAGIDRLAEEGGLDEDLGGAHGGLDLRIGA